MHSAAFDLSGASKGNRMCPRGAPSSISRNSLSLFTLLLNCGRCCRRRHHRRAALFFFPQFLCSRSLVLSVLSLSFPLDSTDSDAESGLSSSERSNIGPACSLCSTRSLLLLLLRLVCSSFSPTRSRYSSIPFALLVSSFLHRPSRHSSSLLRSSSIQPALPRPTCPSSLPAPFFFLSFLHVPTRHYLLSLAFVASPRQ